MSHHRQLAAILFTDIEGYTAIMQDDEERAIAMRDRHRSVLETEHARFNGNIVQYYGDGSLSIFQSLVEAAQCAVAMQRQFQQQPRVPVRMGLHMGDIVFNDGQVFGDGINIASRVESLGVPGSVLISDKANDELRNQPTLKTLPLGTYQLKNVARPIAVFALSHDGLVVPQADSLTGKTQSDEKTKTANGGHSGPADALKTVVEKSIAVLPFVNMSNDPEQEYFGDGIAEEIINSLSQIKDLKVAGRTSSFQFKGTNADLRVLGDKLGVQHVLEGSIRKQGNFIRVTAQLINVGDGYHLWSQRYDRQMDDVFAIQDDIALSITRKLKLTLFRKNRSLVSKNAVHNKEAYELYLKGRFYISRRGASILTGIQFFQQAIEMEPGFAAAHAGYADASLLIATYGLLPSKQVMLQAKQSAERALQLDPTLCEPYCALGYYYTCNEWNWPLAKQHFLKAIEINPRYAEGHFRYGWNYLACVEGKFDEAEKHGEIAVSLEPLSSIVYSNYSFILHCAGKFEQALAACRKGIELDANAFLCHVNAGASLMAMGRFDEALVSFEAAKKLSNRHFFTIHPYIWIYCLTGRQDKARQLMLELQIKAKSEYVANTLTGLSAAYLNDMDAAFDYMDKACDDRDPVLVMLKYEPWVPDSVRKDPRFDRLLARIGFPS